MRETGFGLPDKPTTGGFSFLLKSVSAALESRSRGDHVRRLGRTPRVYLIISRMRRADRPLPP